MDQFIDANIGDLPPGSVAAGAAGAIVAGLLYCFLGYRVFRFLLAFTGFVLAGSVAGGLAGWLSHGRLVWMIPCLVLGGVAGAMALFFMYRAGVFFIGLLGAALGAQAVLAGRPESWIPWAILGTGLAGGLVALWIERPVMTLATAALGASIVVQAGALLVGLAGFQEVLNDPDNQPALTWVILAGWAVLALGGAVTQLATYRPKKAPE